MLQTQKLTKSRDNVAEIHYELGTISIYLEGATTIVIPICSRRAIAKRVFIEKTCGNCEKNMM